MYGVCRSQNALERRPFKKPSKTIVFSNGNLQKTHMFFAKNQHFCKKRMRFFANLQKTYPFFANLQKKRMRF